MGTVYLLHLAKPMAHSSHYIGYADDLNKRLYHHRNGSGARFTQVAHERGIEMELARTWESADRSFERRLKNCKHAARLCPICNGKNALNHMKGH